MICKLRYEHYIEKDQVFLIFAKPEFQAMREEPDKRPPLMPNVCVRAR